MLCLGVGWLVIKQRGSEACIQVQASQALQLMTRTTPLAGMWASHWPTEWMGS